MAEMYSINEIRKGKMIAANKSLSDNLESSIKNMEKKIIAARIRLSELAKIIDEIQLADTKEKLDKVGKKAAVFFGLNDEVG